MTRVIKKSKTPEPKIEEETFKVLSSNKFCEGCKNTDVRAIKDTLTYVLNTMYMVSKLLNVNEVGWEATCKKFRKMVVEHEKNEARRHKILAKRGKEVED